VPIKVKQHYRNVNGKLVLVHEHDMKGETHFHVDDEFDKLFQEDTPAPAPAPKAEEPEADHTPEIEDEFEKLFMGEAVDEEFDKLFADAKEEVHAEAPSEPAGQHPVDALVKMPDGTFVTWKDGATITKKGDKLAYTGPYNYKVKNALKEIPGRKWDSDTHSWLVPLDKSKELSEVMDAHYGDAVDITLPSKAAPAVDTPAPQLVMGEKVPFDQLKVGMKLVGTMTGKPLQITAVQPDFVQYQKWDDEGNSVTLQSDKADWPGKHYSFQEEGDGSTSAPEFKPTVGSKVPFDNLKPGMVLTGNISTTLKVHIDSVNGNNVTYTKTYEDDTLDNVTLTRSKNDWEGYTYVYANDQTMPSAASDGPAIGKEPAFDDLKPGMVIKSTNGQHYLVVDNTGTMLINQAADGSFFSTPKAVWDSHPGVTTLEALDATNFGTIGLASGLSVGDIKVIDGVSYQLNANHRWEKMSDQPDKSAPVGPSTAEQLTNLDTWHNVTINGVKLYKQGSHFVVYKTDADGVALKAGVKQAIAGIAAPFKKQKMWYVSITDTDALAKILDDKDALKAKKPTQAKKPKVAQAQIADGFPFTKLSGPQGSNPGGLYQDAFGKKWYIKFPATEDHAKNEYLANKLYLGMGLDVPKVKLVKEGGKVGIASAYVEGLKNVGESLSKVPGALDGFGADAWLCNWDAVGATHDNMLVDSEGKAIRVDPGGAMIYRAQGTPKAADEFGNTVPEIETMRNGKNAQASSVFGKMSKDQIDASVAKVLALDDDDIMKACEKWGPGDEAARKALANKLIARKAYLAKKFPGADAIANPPAPDPRHLPVDPTLIPAKINFSSYHPDGKPLSSKQWKNDANQKVFDELYATAMKGNLEDFKDFKYMSINPDTGEETGIKTMSNDGHPNKDISQFYGSCVGMLENIAYPSGKKVSSWLTEDAEDIAGLNDAFPSHTFGTTVDKVAHEKRLGFWISLGNVDSHLQFMPQKTANVSQALKDEGKKDYNKMSQNLRSWLGSVQGSGSANIGDSAYNTGQSHKKLVQEAYDRATEFPEGTTIRRYLNMDSAMMNLLKTAPDGHIFQNPRSMCCSMNPKWESAGSKWGNVHLEIVYAKGAKGLATYGSGSFMNGQNNSMDEQEITSLPGQRYMIMSKGTTPGGKPKYQLLVLPPDPSYIADLKS
jgi:hypothetical protein